MNCLAVGIDILLPGTEKVYAVPPPSPLHRPKAQLAGVRKALAQQGPDGLHRIVPACTYTALAFWPMRLGIGLDACCCPCDGRAVLQKGALH